jgi:autotransporter-associated beta strand protein
MKAIRQKSGKFINRFVRPLATGVLCISAAQLFAANQTWNNGGANSTWDTTSLNWSGAAWTNGNTAIFGATGAGEITVASGISAIGVSQINANGYSFSGSAVSLGGLQLASGVSTSFNNAITTTGADVTLNGGSLNLAGGGTIFSNSNWRQNAAGTGTVNFTAGNYTFGGMNFSAGGSTTAMNGTVSGAATLTGTTGIFAIGYSAASSFTYDSSGTSNMAALIVARDGVSSFVQKQGTVNLSNNGAFALQISSRTANGTLDLEGGALNMVAGSTLTVNANNAATGTLNVKGGTLTARTLALNSGAGGSSVVRVTGTGTLNVDAITTANGGTKSINLDGGTVGTTASTSATWSPNMSLGGNVNFRAATLAGATANITLSGVLSGAGGFTKVGAGTLTLTNNGNDFEGNLVVDAGTLATSTTGRLGTGNVRLSAGTVLSLGNNASIADTASIVFDSTMGTGSDIILSFANGSAETIYTLSSIGGVSVAAGTYDAGQLNTAFGTDVFSGAGSLTILASVPEPSTYAVMAGVVALGAVGLRRRRPVQAN